MSEGLVMGLKLSIMNGMNVLNVLNVMNGMNGGGVCANVKNGFNYNEWIECKNGVMSLVNSKKILEQRILH